MVERQVVGLLQALDRPGLHRVVLVPRVLERRRVPHVARARADGYGRGGGARCGGLEEEVQERGLGPGAVVCEVLQRVKGRVEEVVLSRGDESGEVVLGEEGPLGEVGEEVEEGMRGRLVLRGGGSVT